jgi:hypothetical protein
MFTFNIIGTALLFAVLIIEFLFIILHRPEKKLVNDMAANSTLGVLIILTGLFEKGMEFSFFPSYTILLFSLRN